MPQCMCPKGLESLTAWYLTMPREQTENISEIFIKSGDAKTLYLEFVPPYNVETGEYNLVSLVESSTMCMNRI